MGGVNMTAKIIPFYSRKDNCEYVEEDLTALLQGAIRDKYKYVAMQEGKIIEGAVAIEEYCRIVMNMFLLNEGEINSILFRCVIYTSRIIAESIGKALDGFYSLQYYVEAINTDNLNLLREGGDMCYLICTFFPEYANRRFMTVGDCEQIGRQMYYKYYQKSENSLGLYMGNNFKTMVMIAQECMYIT
jgi:hypothetical protein